MRQITLALLLATLMAAPFAVAAKGQSVATLTYRGDNKWVAPADNKPLQVLLKAAREGARHFTVKIPSTERDLNVARLEVLTTLLAREAKHGVVLEEAAGSARANQIIIGF